jgi:hypothetical protein
MIAIAFDLALGLVFGLIGLGLRLAWGCIVMAYRVARFCVVTAYRLVVAVLGLPLRAIRAVSVASSSRAVVKPAWVSLDEL